MTDKYNILCNFRDIYSMFLVIPILGPFVTGLEYASDTKAEVVGKPTKTFFLQAMKEFNCDPENVVMIGNVRMYYQL